MSRRIPSNAEAFHITWTDIWSHHSRADRLPATAKFLVAYSTWANPFDIDEALFLQSNRGVHRLWLVSGLDRGTLQQHCQSPRKWPIDTRDAALISAVIEGSGANPSESELDELLINWIDARSGVTSIGEAYQAGRLTAQRWNDLRNRVLRERDKAAEAARKRLERLPSEIVRVAAELGLGPEPVGSNDISWVGNCPGTNHSIMIGSDSDTWGCGYCCRKGGPEELRAHVRERRERQQARRVWS